MVLRTRIAAALAAAVLLVGNQPASAEDAEASRPPRTSGPLIGLAVPCEDNGPARPQQAKGQSCSWVYELVPVETDTDEDFGVYWVQMEIDPGKGWCAKKIVFDSEIEDGRIVSATPDEDGPVPREGITNAHLVVDGGGTAPVPGEIDQDVMIPSGRTAITITDARYRFVWTGNTPDKVMVAIGLQLAHASEPLAYSYSASELQGFTMGSCRPIIVRIKAHQP